MRKNIKQDKTAIIEELVRARKTKLATKEIHSFLKSEGTSFENKFIACEWYRRLGLLKEAYKVVAPRKWYFSKLKNDPKIARHYLWVARLLNLLGATKYAILICENLTGHSPEEWRVLGNIYLSAYMYDKSLQYFTMARDQASVSEKSSYQSRLAILGISDSLAGLKRFNEAIKVASTIQVKKEESRLSAIIEEAKSEYFAQKGEFQKAKKLLKNAFPEFTHEDHSTDRGFLLKWLAYVEAKLGNLSEAQNLFSEALQILQTPTLRAEAWLECYDLMFRCNLLSHENICQLYAFPGKPIEFQKREMYPTALTLYSRKSRIKIYMDRNEYEIDNKKYYGLNKEIQLLGYLRMSFKSGISCERIKTLLWPDEIGSFLALQSRLNLLLNRIRTVFKVNANVINGLIVLAEDSINQISVEYGFSQLSFFEKNTRFSSSEFADYYGLKKTASVQALNKLVDSSKVIVSPKEKSKKYSII